MAEEFTSAAAHRRRARRPHMQPAREIVQAIAHAVADHRAGFPPNDDMTIVALRMLEVDSSVKLEGRSKKEE